MFPSTDAESTPRMTPASVAWRDNVGNGEVEHLDDALLRDLDVGGLEVAMHDALFVRGLERVNHLLGVRDGLGNGDRTAREPLREHRACW